MPKGILCGRCKYLTVTLKQAQYLMPSTMFPTLDMISQRGVEYSGQYSLLGRPN